MDCRFNQVTKKYSKEQLEMVISNAAADPNSFGDFTDPYTSGKYPIKMALVVGTEFTKYINSAKTFEKLIHERLKQNLLDTKEKKMVNHHLSNLLWLYLQKLQLLFQEKTSLLFQQVAG